MAKSLLLYLVSIAALRRMGHLESKLRRLLAGSVLLHVWLLCRYRNGLLPAFPAFYPWRGFYRDLLPGLGLHCASGKRPLFCSSHWPRSRELLLGTAPVLCGFWHDSH